MGFAWRHDTHVPIYILDGFNIESEDRCLAVDWPVLRAAIRAGPPMWLIPAQKNPNPAHDLGEPSYARLRAASIAGILCYILKPVALHALNS